MSQTGRSRSDADCIGYSPEIDSRRTVIEPRQTLKFLQSGRSAALPIHNCTAQKRPSAEPGLRAPADFRPDLYREVLWRRF